MRIAETVAFEFTRKGPGCALVLGTSATSFITLAPTLFFLNILCRARNS